MCPKLFIKGEIRPRTEAFRRHLIRHLFYRTGVSNSQASCHPGSPKVKHIASINDTKNTALESIGKLCLICGLFWGQNRITGKGESCAYWWSDNNYWSIEDFPDGGHQALRCMLNSSVRGHGRQLNRRCPKTRPRVWNSSSNLAA